MAQHLSAADVPDSFKTAKYWRLMDAVSEAQAKRQGSREKKLLASVQEELHKSFANKRAGKMIHK